LYFSLMIQSAKKKVSGSKPSTERRRNMPQFECGFNSHETAAESASPRKAFDFKSRTNSNNREALIEIIADGTNLMKKIGLPTVLIKIFKRKFCKAMLHYVVIEPVSGSSVGEIPALLVSHPRSPEKGRTTSEGELLPLVIQNCKASGNHITQLMLQSPRYQEVFKNGCMFRLRLIKLGRLLEGPSLSKHPEILKRLISRDIQSIPNTFRLLKQFSPRTEPNTVNVLSRKMPDLENKEDENISRWLRNLSDFAPDFRLRGLRASRGKCDFARWFSAIPPDVVVDEDFRCDKGILKKDSFLCVGELDRYLGVSEVI